MQREPLFDLRLLAGHFFRRVCTAQAEFEKRINPTDKAQMSLLEEMRAHVKKVKSKLMYTSIQVLLYIKFLHFVDVMASLCSSKISGRTRTLDCPLPRLNSRRHREHSQSASRWADSHVWQVSCCMPHRLSALHTSPSPYAGTA